MKLRAIAMLCLVAGCGMTAQQAKTDVGTASNVALTITDLACLASASGLIDSGSTAQDLAEICKIAPGLIGDVQKIVAEYQMKKATFRAQAAAFMRKVDGGTDSGK